MNGAQSSQQICAPFIAFLSYAMSGTQRRHHSDMSHNSQMQVVFAGRTFEAYHRD